VTAVWGWTFVVVKDAISHYPTVPFLAIRFAIGLVVMLLIVRRRPSLRTLGLGALIGAVLASGGGHPDETAKLYTNGLLLLSYWASPWAAVIFFDWIGRRKQPYAPDDAFAVTPAIKSGTMAWIGGLLASLPFWDQAWYTGPFAARFPQFGDLSYFIGFAVAGLLMHLLSRRRTA